MNLQFYPTPKGLAKQAWSKFTNRQFTRVLEPSAGSGDLAIEHPRYESHWKNDKGIDCVEIDVSKHSVLRGAQLNVVGTDFLQMESGAIYSHIIMNPPFQNGAEHVLKAWDMLWEGEVVAIINAETLRNPHSKIRQQLLEVIQANGSVEFLQGEFLSDEAERKTAVEIALVHLSKKVDVEKDIYQELMGDLRKEKSSASDGFAEGYRQHDTELAIPANEVENRVCTYQAAVRAMQTSVFARAKQSHYANMLGPLIQDRRQTDDAESSVQWVIKQINAEYDALKNRAWTSILRSTAVLAKLSSNAQKALESSFADIKHLEFTAFNIHGFLQGLCEQQSSMLMDVLCEVFDNITKYHSDNTVYYKGWKSNDKHRTMGKRIKTTRFILPFMQSNPGRGFDWETERRLHDIEKAFALLDGKTDIDFQMTASAFQNVDKFDKAQRLNSTYFEFRHYRGVRTIHFFPTRVDLIERMNRMVGQHRRWLPSNEADMKGAFKKQYDEAEKFDKQFREKISNVRAPGIRGGDELLRAMDRNQEDSETRNAIQAASRVFDELLLLNGIDLDGAVEHDRENDLMLLAA